MFNIIYYIYYYDSPTSYGCILRVPLDMSLPVGIKSVKQKLKSINKSTKSLKSSPLVSLLCS